MAAPTVTAARALHFDGTESALALPDVLATAAAGTPVLVPGLLERIGVLGPIRDLYLATVADHAGAPVAARLGTVGLEHLHESVAPDVVAALLADLDARARPLTVPVIRALVAEIGPALGDRYFLSARMSVRALVPLERLDGHADLLGQRQLEGHLLPVGLHRDPDLTHPFGTLVGWGAIGPVEAGNTMALHAPDGGRPLTPVLDPGDVLVFSADLPHASVPNRTSRTRVGIGVRVVPGTRLRYGRGHHWRPYLDARLLDTPFAPLASWRSRATAAAFRRWRWRRAWAREQLGGFDESIFVDDWPMWLRIADRYAFARMDECVVRYRQTPGGVSRSPGYAAQMLDGKARTLLAWVGRDPQTDAVIRHDAWAFARWCTAADPALGQPLLADVAAAYPSRSRVLQARLARLPGAPVLLRAALAARDAQNARRASRLRARGQPVRVRGGRRASGGG